MDSKIAFNISRSKGERQFYKSNFYNLNIKNHEYRVQFKIITNPSGERTPVRLISAEVMNKKTDK